MHNYKELLDKVKGIEAAVNADKSLGDKTFETYRRLASIIADRHYWFYDREGEDKTARKELEKLVAGIQAKYKPMPLAAKSWEMKFSDLDYCSTTAPAEIVKYVFGDTGGTLLLPSEKFYKDKAAAERAKKLSAELDKRRPRAVFMIDEHSMGLEQYEECDKLLKPLKEPYEKAWAGYVEVKKYLEKGEEIPKDVEASYKKAFDAYNKLRDTVRKGKYKDWLN